MNILLFRQFTDGNQIFFKRGIHLAQVITNFKTFRIAFEPARESRIYRFTGGMIVDVIPAQAGIQKVFR
jgi:hypothetical protein